MSSKNKANQKAYESIARIYAGDEPAEDDPIMRASCRELFIKGLKGKEVLEVGCGPGVDSSFFYKAGLAVTATDFCHEFVKIVQERYPEIKCFEMDMTNIHLPKGSFDGIYGFASFLHIPRSQGKAVLKSFYDLLKRRGMLFLSLIESNKFPEYVIENWGGQENNPVLFTCYSPEEITRELKDAGFVEVEIHRVESELYANLPRLVERGVKHYQVLAFKGESDSLVSLITKVDPS